jgi:hypothetical protein
MEAQFDENTKFKQSLAEQMLDSNDYRAVPTGRDKDGTSYWFFMDSEGTFRLFTQNATDTVGKTWRLLTK